MSHTHRWLIESSVFYNEYNGDVSIEDLKIMSSANLLYLEGSNAPLVHSIVNIENMGHIPLNIYTLKEGTLATLQHPKTGWVVAYGKNDSFLTFLSNMLTQVTKTRYKTFGSYADAIGFLQSVDTTLPDLQKMGNPGKTSS